MSKTLQFWAGDFARRARGIIDSVKGGAVGDRAKLRGDFVKMIRALQFGWAIVEDLTPAVPVAAGLPEGIDFTKVVEETAAAGPTGLGEPFDVAVTAPYGSPSEVKPPVSDSRWWKDKNRFTHFVNHVRRVLGVDMDMEVGKLLKKAATEVNIVVPSHLPKGWAKKKDKQKTFAQAVVTMLGVNVTWLGTNEEENLSYLLAALENVLVRVRAAKPVVAPVAPGLVVPTGSKLDVVPPLKLVKGGRNGRHGKREKTVKKTAARRRLG
jgi:hypothetical protein